ncbi:hypothetical protein SAMN05216266_10691 [Amycolatopsis marina]|uniref:Uncharacterized protein n=1 Tax=Amycolatopsis marina TaxID=490629 RepID=A0A1I0Z750_9PSEU|nr:hypothetical protein [Amycolatopsis marina]SFB20248.1 hypothetical protein SAMN05216266_10691 [Amycolatopsis marina]
MAEMIANTLFLFVLAGAVAGLGRMARLHAGEEQATLPLRSGQYDLGIDLTAGLRLLWNAGQARAERLDNQLREMNSSRTLAQH